MRHFNAWLVRNETLHAEVLLFVIFVTVITAFILILGEADVLKGMADLKSMYWGEVVLIATSSYGEEVIFRMIPLGGVMYFCTHDTRILTMVIIATSFMFANAHAFYLDTGLIAAAGAVFSLAYLKFGGYVGQYTKALFFTGSVHFIGNLIGITIINSSH